MGFDEMIPQTTSTTLKDLSEQQTPRLLLVQVNAGPSSPDGVLPWLDEEQRQIRQLKDLQVEALVATTRLDLVEKLKEFEPHCVHFSGHGSKEGLHLSRGEFFPVNEVVAELKACKSCKMVVFNCCESIYIATAVCQNTGVYHAIGTTTAVVDQLATTCGSMFWAYLLTGQTVGQAFENVRGLLQDDTYELVSNDPVVPQPDDSTGSEIQSQVAGLLQATYQSDPFTHIPILDFELGTVEDRVHLNQIYTELMVTKMFSHKTSPDRPMPQV